MDLFSRIMLTSLYTAYFDLQAGEIENAMTMLKSSIERGLKQCGLPSDNLSLKQLIEMQNEILQEFDNDNPNR